MKRTSLVLMAAGLGSRFGGGIKQLEPVGENNEIIMDYSIHDAIRAGFNKIVFIIRKDIEADFKDRIGNRIERICIRLNVEVAYCYQELTSLPFGLLPPEGRTKPWGTGQAVLAAKNLIHEPFAVINADDYYGQKAFQKMHDWLIEEHADSAIAMAGFILGNTLSEYGGVTRGLCQMEQGHTHITGIVETSNIRKTTQGAEADGVALDLNSIVSMNFWGFPAREGKSPAYLENLEIGFAEFLHNAVPKNPMKSEYLLPIHIGNMLKQGECSVKILETDDQWFGVTYKEDTESVKKNFRMLIENGIYTPDLYNDLEAEDAEELQQWSGFNDR